MNPPRCYGIRLVNPFLGTLQVAHLGEVRALSRDGHDWEIQVLVESDTTAGWGSLNRRPAQPRYYRSGFWNPQHGLRRMPVDPSLDAQRLREGAERIIQRLQAELLQRLPFPLEDLYELWLLDNLYQPLALLGSTEDKTQIPRFREQRWQAVSAMQGIADYTPRQAEPLERLIRQQAGLRQWFRRGSNGEGVGLNQLCPARLADRILPPGDFPQLLVRDEWGDARSNELTRVWSDHLAPWLLQLPGLHTTKRSSLEQAASRQPQMVESMHRLYPEVIDQQLIKTSRVAARLLQANG